MDLDPNLDRVHSAPPTPRSGRARSRLRWPLVVSLAMHAGILGAATLILTHSGPPVPTVGAAPEAFTLHLDLRRTRPRPEPVEVPQNARAPIPEARALAAPLPERLDREVWAAVARPPEDVIPPPQARTSRGLTATEGARRGRFPSARGGHRGGHRSGQPDAPRIADGVGAPAAGVGSGGEFPTTGVGTGSGQPDELGTQTDGDGEGPGLGGSVARAVAAPRPDYPSASRQRGEQGTVTCRIHVRADGTVESVDVLESSGSYRLDQAALAALRQWTFAPALHRGEPIASVVDQDVRFSLTG